MTTQIATFKTVLFKPVFIVFLLSTLILVGCGEKSSAPAFQRPPAPVSVIAAIKQDVPVYLDAVGKTVAREMVSIQPQVSGRITQIHFVDGAYVKKGSPLFTVDPRPYQAQLHSAEANFAETQASLDLAKTDFERVANLVNTKAISKQDYDAKKNAVAVAEAQLKQKKAEIEMAQLNLAYCFITSPIEGRTGQRLVDLGNIVVPNGPSLLTIQRLDPIYADFTIPENDLTNVQINMRDESLNVEVRLPDDPTRVRQGSLTFLDNSVQDGAGTVKLRATVPNQDHYFWPGRFVNIRVVLSTQSGAILIPAAAPQMSAKGTFVYTVNRDSTAELRPVTLGQRQGDLVVITQGLQPGERVVVTGQLGVTPGGKVLVHETPESRAGTDANLPVGNAGDKS